MEHYNPENQENRSISDEQVVDALKKGFDDPQTKEVYNQWFDRQQEEADRIGTNTARMECAVSRAVVYYKAGYIEEAIADLKETIDGIVNMNEKGEESDELKARADALLGKMLSGQIL